MDLVNAATWTDAAAVAAVVIAVVEIVRFVEEKERAAKILRFFGRIRNTILTWYNTKKPRC